MSQQQCQGFLLHISRTLDTFNRCFKIGCQRLHCFVDSLNSIGSLCWHLEKRLEYTENSFTSVRLMLMKKPTSLNPVFPPIHLQIISDDSIRPV